MRGRSKGRIVDEIFLNSFSEKCTQEDPPACETMCPLHVDARGLARLTAAGKYAEARRLLERAMPLACLSALLCEGPCMAHCRRAEVDGGVNLPLLERFLAQSAPAQPPMPLPASGKKALILGAGLSSLVAAFDLGKKGIAPEILHTGAPDAAIRAALAALPDAVLPDAVLPEAVQGRALAETMAQLERVRVTWRRMDALTPELLAVPAGVAGSPDADGVAVYLGADDPAVAPLLRDLPRPDPVTLGVGQERVTLAAGLPRVFCGGFSANGPASFIQRIADAKRASTSVDRIFRGGAANYQRDKEATRPSLLYTDLGAVAPAPPIAPANALIPTPEEARAEAGRCIQCECLECVKKCPYLAHYKGYPKKYFTLFASNLAPLVLNPRAANRQINSCAQCGQCAAICPNGADMAAFCDAARREMVRGQFMPPSHHEFALLDMEHSNSADIAFLRPDPDTGESAWLFFPGCRLPAALPEQTRAVYAHLRRHLDGGVGLLFHCCGAPAAWSGREKLTATTAAAIRARWEEAGSPARKPTVILACSSCLAFFKKHLPDIPAVSLWDKLAACPLPPEAKAAKTTLALHDPCSARNEPGVRGSARALLAALGQDVEELAVGRELTRCCGYGGLASAANPALGKAYAQSRADDTANPLLAYCAMCRESLRAVGKPAMHLLELLFPGTGEHFAARALERPALGISARQQAQLNFRRAMLKSVWDEAPEEKEEKAAMENARLRMTPETEDALETRRILRSDILAVLARAEEDGPLFVNADRALASLRPRQVTFWVEYTRHGEGDYTIHNAYCHRMVAPGVPGAGAPTPATQEGSAS